MSDLDFANIAHLLEDPKAVLNDLKETEVKLHSTAGVATIGPTTLSNHTPGSKPAISFGTNTPSIHGPGQPSVTLASLMTERQAIIKGYNDASPQKRLDMLANPADRLRLFSIIFAEYRPAPPLVSGHRLAANALPARIAPGGKTWDEIVTGLPIDVWSRHAVRLDNAANVHQGSGTLMAGGRILTAWHVISGPGYVFGNPPSPSSGVTGVAACNKVVGGAAVNLTISGYMAISNLDSCWINAASDWPAALGGTEFAANTGLPLQKTALTAAELAGRKVVVIGHPGAPSTASDAALAPQVFTGAPYGTKRFMVGTLHPTNPLGTANGVDYLRHDCSTLGGASGSCVVDLLTGVVLGVHVSGKSSTENRNGAVPAWLIDFATPDNLL